MTEQNTRAGLWLMVLTTVIFSSQDGITKHLAGNYPIAMVVMVRSVRRGSPALATKCSRASSL